MTKILITIFTLLYVGSCASNQVPTKVLSEPEWRDVEVLENEKKITIASINYFNSSIATQVENFDQIGTMRIGGLQLIKKYSSILKERLPDQVLMLSAGDLINENQKGGVDSILDDFENIGFDAFHLSESELKMLSIKQIAKTSNSFINSNIIELSKKSPLKSKNIDNYMVKTINGVKVGVIAVTTYKNTEARKHKYLNGLYFEDPVYSILKLHDQLKRKGVEVFVLMIKGQRVCKDGECTSNKEELSQLIKRLPPKKIDVIIGSEPELINQKIGGIPFIQNLGQGKYLSRIDLFFDTKTKTINDSKTLMHSPIKLCSQFFKATNDCHIEDDYYKEAKTELIKDSHMELSRAYFLGIEI